MPDKVPQALAGEVSPPMAVVAFCDIVDATCELETFFGPSAEIEDRDPSRRVQANEAIRSPQGDGNAICLLPTSPVQVVVQPASVPFKVSVETKAIQE